jgi:hypothetical protein
MSALEDGFLRFDTGKSGNDRLSLSVWFQLECLALVYDLCLMGCGQIVIFADFPFPPPGEKKQLA